MIPRLPKGFTHPMTIGEGAFSSVYRARQKVLDRWVAVKVLREKDPVLRAKLLEEARTQASLALPCIPAVYDAFAGGQNVWIVMEWIKGASLQAILARGIPSAADRAALAGAVVASLAELHRRGYAHRDLKPANILVSVSESVYLVDFGFAKKVGEGGMSIAGSVKGTPAYMAPEVWRGDPGADLMRADLFSLGRVLAELNPGPPWKALADRLVATEPAARPASAAALWEEWRDLPAANHTPAWKDRLGGLASESLAKLLLAAARDLLLSRRREEAYWLLAECLQEDPDGAEALKLMEGYPQAAIARRLRSRWAVAAASVAAIAIAIAFLAGRETGKQERVRIRAADEGSLALLLPARGSGKAGATEARFRDIQSGPGRIAGLVFLAEGSGCDSLEVDGAAWPAAEAARGIPVRPGAHAFACVANGAATAAPEKVSVLPFQRKIMRPGSGKG